MVATAKPGQGGTTTICNLAITIAQAGRRVILVDADLRRPSLHRIFETPNEEGLSTLLQDGTPIASALQKTEIENLVLLPAGPPPENPWKLLRSARMRDLIETLKENADYVFFDAPSAMVFADAVVLASLLDGVILVIRASQSPRGGELQIRNLLNKAGARVLGIVLNDAPADTVDSYNYHAHYYQSGPSLKALESRATTSRIQESFGDD